MYNIKIFSIKHMNQKTMHRILHQYWTDFSKHLQNMIVWWVHQPLQENHKAWKLFRPILPEF